MKPLMLAFTILAVAGCAVHKPAFNQTYLPNTLPGLPQKKIDLTREVADKVSVKKWGLFTENRTTSLYWAEDDTLLLNISKEHGKNPLYSFRIAPRTGEIKLLEAAEKNVFLSRREKSVSVKDTATLAGSIAKTAAEFMGFLISAGRYQGNSTDHYIGKLENNGFILDFDFITKAKGGGPLRSVHYDCNYAANNRQTESVFEGDVRIEKEVEEGKIRKLERSLEEWLASWRVAPDGRAYVITRTAQFSIPEIGKTEFRDLIQDYPYAGFDISPNWDRIALLMAKEDEKTKKMNYWIEFYPFKYKMTQIH